MDDEKRSSLTLIVALAVKLPLADRGMQLIHVVRQFVDDEDLAEARRVLRLIPNDYYADHMYTDALKDGVLRDDVARLIEVLGYGFWLFARDAASA
jgi:hypothetical protein